MALLRSKQGRDLEWAKAKSEAVDSLVKFLNGHSDRDGIKEEIEGVVESWDSKNLGIFAIRLLAESARRGRYEDFRKRLENYYQQQLREHPGYDVGEVERGAVEYHRGVFRTIQRWYEELGVPWDPLLV